MSDKPIVHLSIYMPHGATMRQCEVITAFAGKLTKTSISQGGFTPVGDFGIQEGCKFHKDSMSFTLGYEDKADAKAE